MNCPVCSTELKVADRQGIEIDFCPKCRGVWLDRGELEKIIERSGAQAHYDDDYDDDDDRQRRGQRSHDPRGPYPPEGRWREGFFGRLFDFD
jgi:Zn-finger nucleic acid-binding protein